MKHIVDIQRRGAMCKMKKTRKYGWIILISVVIAMIVVPCLIHTFSPDVISEITADALLGYIGNIVTAIPTIVIAAVAIWQTKKANKIAKESNKIAEKALSLTEEANRRADDSNNISIEANKISKKLLELEELRQQLELRPSFAVINWSAPVRNLNAIYNNPELLSIQIGSCPDTGEVWGIELEILNTSSGFETIFYNKMMNDKGDQIGCHSQCGMKTNKIYLPALKTSRIYFYAEKDFWENHLKEKIIVEFFLNNRLDSPYRERFEMYILSMSEEIFHMADEVYLYLNIQNYTLGKYVGKSEKFPEGVEWEKID